MNEINRKKAEKIADILCSSAFVANGNLQFKGAKEAIAYKNEFMSEVYWPLIDYDENVVFIDKAAFQKFGNKKPFFDGTFVKIFRKPYYGTKYTYYVYCPATSKLLGTCYLKAKEFSFKFY